MMESISTIVALSTPKGEGAIGVLRMSGEDSISIALSYLSLGKKSLPARKAVYASFLIDGKVLDEVLVVAYYGPKSYTGEDVVEISFHGSSYILTTALNALITRGAQMAQPGEFTQRAFLNGKMDLSQAEAVAEVISSENRSQHNTALDQMRGGVSDKIKTMRQKLLDFASLIELELDFSEEDVEFANRDELITLIGQILGSCQSLIQTFKLGNAIKHGVSVAIVGKPNVGKSTLLNSLLGDDRAIVSDIAGTTRDTIEDVSMIDGVKFRFIDTAGLRDTKDKIESFGIKRSYASIRKAQVIIYLFESGLPLNEVKTEINRIYSLLDPENQYLLVIANKIDLAPLTYDAISIGNNAYKITGVIANDENSIKMLEKKLFEEVIGQGINDSLIVTNSRHVTELEQTQDALTRARSSVESNISGDLVAADIREALNHLGAITGEITTEDLLGNIFSSFCIGK